MKSNLIKGKVQRINTTRWLAFIFVLVTITLNGCSNSEAINIVMFEPKDYQVYFYSNESDTKIEDTYLSAMVELKTNYPSEINQFELKETTSDSLSNKAIAEYPTMIIEKNGETVSTLSGEKPKSEIVEELKQTIESTKAAVPNP